MRPMILVLPLLFTAVSLRATELERHPKIISIASNQLINEVRRGDEFYFERCDFYHVDGTNLNEELAAKSFVNCVPIGVPQPLASRAAVESQLNLALRERRKVLADPSVMAWAAEGFVRGALIGGLVPTAARMVVRGPFPIDKTLRTFARYGGFFGVASMWVQTQDAMSRRGHARKTLGVWNVEMPDSPEVLDQRSNDHVAHNQAMENVGAVIAAVMSTFIP